MKSNQTKLSSSKSEHELETTASKYHLIAAWVAVIFDPVFAITDYINIPQGWKELLVIRLGVSAVTVVAILIRKRYVFSSFIIAFIPFILISVQNAYTYQFLDSNGLLGQNLNYMALLVGAGMFVLWRLRYSLLVVAVSCLTTFWFIYINPNLTMAEFLQKGGLLLIVTAIFMVVLIRTRFNLTIREIEARVALKISNDEIQRQATEIRSINENLERVVWQRTNDLEKRNKALQESAFINAHKLRSPVANILGLTNLFTKLKLNGEGATINKHLQQSAKNLDKIVNDISRIIEKGSE